MEIGRTQPSGWGHALPSPAIVSPLLAGWVAERQAVLMLTSRADDAREVMPQLAAACGMRHAPRSYNDSVGENLRVVIEGSDIAVTAAGQRFSCPGEEGWLRAARVRGCVGLVLGYFPIPPNTTPTSIARGCTARGSTSPVWSGLSSTPEHLAGYTSFSVSDAC
jgi:hypothetical protein